MDEQDPLVRAVREQNRALRHQNAILTHLAWVLNDGEQSPTSFYRQLADWKVEREDELEGRL